MDTQALQFEDTSASFHSTTDFNIASAFPETDRLLAAVARHRRKQWIVDNRGVLLCIAAGALGILTAGRIISR